MRIEVGRKSLKMEYRNLDIKDINLSHLTEDLDKSNLIIFSDGDEFWNKKILYSKEEHECGFNPHYNVIDSLPIFSII